MLVVVDELPERRLAYPRKLVRVERPVRAPACQPHPKLAGGDAAYVVHVRIVEECRRLGVILPAVPLLSIYELEQIACKEALLKGEVLELVHCGCRVSE